MATPKEVAEALKKMPYDIIAFYLFSMIVVAFSFYLDFDKELKTSLMPYTGWSFGNSYVFPLFFIPICLFSFNGKWINTLLFIRGFIIIIMLLDCYDGFKDWQSTTPEDYTNPNPYLRYDALTPVCTIGVPLFWVVLMLLVIGYTVVKNKRKKQLGAS